MNFDQFMQPQSKKQRGSKGSRKNNNGGLNYGMGFDGRVMDVGGDFLERVREGGGISISGDNGFSVNGHNQGAINPVFRIEGFGVTPGRSKLERIADKETREEDRAYRKRQKELKKYKRPKEEGGTREYTESGTQRIAGFKGDTIGGKIIGKLTKKHSQYSKDDLRREDQADKETRARLRELIEEEKMRKAEERK